MTWESNLDWGKVPLCLPLHVRLPQSLLLVCRSALHLKDWWCKKLKTSIHSVAVLISSHITSSCISCLSLLSMVYLRTSDVTLTLLYMYMNVLVQWIKVFYRVPPLLMSQTIQHTGSNTCVVAALIYYRRIFLEHPYTNKEFSVHSGYGI